jgi:CheY-like chemotaxis protein
MTKTVLVVDDEAYVRRLVRMVLEGAGHRVLEAGTIAEGLQRMRAEKPHLLTLDLMMPGTEESQYGGLDLLRIKGQDPETQGIPAILLTAAGVQADQAVQRAVEMGANVVLRKPFSQRQLLDAVDQLTAS